jgi:hypothetical protein
MLQDYVRLLCDYVARLPPSPCIFSPAMRRGRPVVVALLGLAVVTLRANRDEWLSFAPWLHWMIIS